MMISQLNHSRILEIQKGYQFRLRSGTIKLSMSGRLLSGAVRKIVVCTYSIEDIVNSATLWTIKSRYRATISIDVGENRRWTLFGLTAGGRTYCWRLHLLRILTTPRNFSCLLLKVTTAHCKVGGPNVSSAILQKIRLVSAQIAGA